MRPHTILVVEDNPITLKMMRVALTADGYAVLEAPDGRTALSLMEQHAPDLVIQDLLLPDMDGFKLVAKLRATEHGHGVPVLAFTGLASKLEEARALSAGFDDFLVKPLEPSRLLETIEAHLPAGARGKPVKGVRLLVADDEPVQLRLARLLLVEKGFAVETAVDGEDALAKAAANPPRAILADVLMPRLDGFKLCWRVRQDPRLRHVPVVLVSSKYVEEADRALARKVGASGLALRTPSLDQAIAALLAAFEAEPPAASVEWAEEVEAEYIHRLVRQLERQAAINTSLLEGQGLKATSLTVLSATAEALSERRDLDQALNQALYFCLDAAGLSVGAVYRAAGEGALRLQTQIGLGEAPGQAEALRKRHELLRTVFESARPTVVPSSDFPEPLGRDFLAGLDSTSALLVPFGSGSQPFGLLLLASQSRNLVEGDWLPFARTLAAQFAQAVALARAFEKIAASEARYRALMEKANDGIMVLSPEGEILEINQRMEEILGLARAEAAGRHISEFTPDARSVAFSEVAARGAGQIENVPVVRADGSRVQMDFSISTVEVDGKPVVLSIGRDVTERKRAEEMLVERARLAAFSAEVNLALTTRETLKDMLQGCCQAMVEHLGAAFARIWTLAADENVLELQASAGIYTHIDGGHARVPVGKFKIGLIAEERQPHLTNDVLADPRLSDPAWARREGMVAFAGYPLVVEGELVGVAALFARQRLTEFTLKALSTAADSLALGIKRKKAEKDLKLSDDQLRQAQKMEAVGQLAGGIAHDFNNLLGVITGYGELLLKDVSEHDPRRRRLDQILGAARRAAALTRQLLAFSRKQVLELRVLDLNAVVAEIEKMLRRVIGENIQLVTIFSADLGRVKADAGQVEQVIMNLAVNARDAISGAGRLIIESSNVELDESYARTHVGVRPGAYVLLSVSDTGHGMDAETRARIFEPFFTTKEVGKGTGLGLATVYGIVRQSGGHVSVYSEPGRGSTFRVYLPRVYEEHEPQREESASPVPAGSETVLLVEDEASLRELIHETLDLSGYRVLEASNPDAALEIVRAHQGPIPLVVTDVVMPHKSGYDLAVELRALRPEARVLFMSGYADEHISQAGVLEAGAFFLQKPFTTEALLRKVREVLEAPPPSGEPERRS